ncbi:MAG TPA: GNAT family protein [Roseiarcus sp.]|nr:GNAT family protein [Roseiarcus sp.]
MALFRINRLADPAPLARGDGLYLRPAQSVDYAAWAALREASRAFLTPWEPSWPADDLTRAAFRRRLKRQAEEIARDEAYSFLIFEEGSDDMLGGITIGGVRRGVAQAATLGYWIGAPYARRGHMTRAVAAATAFGFSSLRLHRIEAACIPDNVASARVLERNGFRKEGFARAYLRINGAWRDHLLFALLESDARAIQQGGRGVG